METTIVPTNLGRSSTGAGTTLHVEAIIGDRQIGVAIVNGHLIQCVNRSWSTQQPKPGMTVEQAANGAAAMLLSRGGVKFV
jgi:hypothetical protein